MSIIDTWEQYFSNNNEGLGTTYERFILHRYFEDISTSFAIKNILEVPSFGMTGISGINSMWWAKRGTDVTVVDRNAKADRFDKDSMAERGVKCRFCISQEELLFSSPFRPFV